MSRDRAHVVYRARKRRVSTRLAVRGLVVGAVIAAVAAGVGLAAVAFGLGQYQLSPLDALATITGTGNLDDIHIVNRVRLPRAAAAVGIGAMLGLAGAIFQSLSRNPLGSPDIIGYNDGAVSGALVTMLVLPGSILTAATGSIVGGLATAVAVYALAGARGGVGGGQLILIGIGMTALLKSFNAYLLTRVDLDEAIAAKVWLYGSLNGLTWSSLWPAAVGLAVFVPLAFALGRDLGFIEMGDATASALGIDVARRRLALMCVGVGLTGCAIATAGPIAFIALAAPQIGRRVTGAASPGLFPAALTGALLPVMADLAGQRLLAPIQIPVGIITGVLGGVYLTVLLILQWRQRHW